MKRALSLVPLVALSSLLSLAAPSFAQPRPPAAPPNAGKVEAAEDIGLALGETKLISARDIKNYTEGVGDVIDVKLAVDNTQFVVTGKRVGSTTLLLVKNDGSSITHNVTVFPKSPVTVEREVTQLLEGTVGVRVRRIGARFFVEGRVANEADVKRIQQIASLYPGQVESLVSMGAAGPERKILVRIDFYFAQYDKSSSYAVGIGYPASIGGDAVVQTQLAYDFVARTATSATASIVNQPLPRLDVAARNGWAKVFKHATVITSNGSEATFESGGEQNFSVNTGLTIGVQRIQFGAFLTVLPTFDAQSKELDVKLDAQVSDLTAPVASNLPGRSTSKLATSIHMKLGQSLVLSGIRTRSQARDISGLPLLSELPVLGLLFGTHSERQQDTEGAIFIVPSVVESVSKPATEMIDEVVDQYVRYRGDIGTVNAYEKIPAGLVRPAGK